MFLKLSRIYGILVIINHGLGLSHTVQNAKKPKVHMFGYGWPPLLVNVSIKTVDIKGIVEYNLLYNRTCPDSCYSRDPVDKGLCEADLSPVDGCFFVEIQTSILPKSLNCIVCNSSENCKFMGITEDRDLCLCLKVTTLAGSSNYTCMERSYNTIFVYPPPNSIQVLATERKELTVQWEWPNESGYAMECRLRLKEQDHDHLGNCMEELRYHLLKENNNFTFTSLRPWTNYSVTICCGLYSREIACTCVSPSSLWSIPGGPVFQRTLPEEPTKAPLLHPCRASCSGKYLYNATLTWQVRDGMMWNGIPTESVIMIWNSSVVNDQTNLGAPDITLSVPLPADYNGSLLTYTIHNLTWNLHVSFHYKLKFCSNGGCGPAEVGTLSCDSCITIKGSATTDTTTPPAADPKTSLIYVIVVAVVTVVIFTCFGTWVYQRTKSRKRIFLRSLGEVIGDVEPENYDELDFFSDSTADSGPYSQLNISDRQALLSANQMPKFV